MQRYGIIQKERRNLVLKYTSIRRLCTV